MRRIGHLSIAVALVVALLGTMPVAVGPAAAHTHVEEGPYEFTVGWRTEPPVAGVLNGLDLGIVWISNQTPVLGAHQDLFANLTKGSARMSPPLAPQFGNPGWYTFDVIPTEPGLYVIQISGNLDGTPVDFPVDLEEVSPASDVEFPRSNPTPGDLQAGVNALQGQVTLLTAIALVGAILAVVSTGALVFLARRLRQRT